MPDIVLMKEAIANAMLVALFIMEEIMEENFIQLPHGLLSSLKEATLLALMVILVTLSLVWVKLASATGTLRTKLNTRNLTLEWDKIQLLIINLDKLYVE